MNTHGIDIELPPLPSPLGIVNPKGTEGMMQYTASDLQDYAKAYALAAIEADRKRKQSEAEEVCGEAYQVIGSLLSDLGIFETDHAQKILDNLSQAKMVHKDVLPWPSFDCQRRGEPVMYQVRIRPAWGEHWSRWEECTREQAEGYRKAPFVHDLHYEVRELYTAPQVAEPVKVPSDADILDLWTGDLTHSRPVMGKNKVIAFARALLARYGQSAPPATIARRAREGG